MALPIVYFSPPLPYLLEFSNLFQHRFALLLSCLFSVLQRKVVKPHFRPLRITIFPSILQFILGSNQLVLLVDGWKEAIFLSITLSIKMLWV